MTHERFPLQQRRRRASRAVAIATMGTALILAACTEPDVILPGAREDVRSVLQNNPPFEGQAPAFVGNQERAIALPAPRANSDWTHTIGSPATRVSHPALGSSLSLQWAADIGEGDSRKFRITADPVVADGRVFTLDAQSIVTATSTGGATLWQADLRPARDQEGDATGGGLVVAGNSVYVSIGYGVLAALNVSDGAVRWTQQLDASGSGYADRVRGPGVHHCGRRYRLGREQQRWDRRMANRRDRRYQ